MPFTFLEHTADVQVECKSSTFEGVLETAAQALYAVTLKETRAGAGITRRVDICGTGREELLVRWLQELIYLLETQQFVATGFRFGTCTADQAQADLDGYLCAPEDRAEEVKSTTYHELEVHDTGHGMTARVIFDV